MFDSNTTVNVELNICYYYIISFTEYSYLLTHQSIVEDDKKGKESDVPFSESEIGLGNASDSTTSLVKTKDKGKSLKSGA